MATIEREYRKNWHDLHLLIDDYFTHYNSYVFRGQADADWSLESSLTRAVRLNYAELANTTSIVNEHLAIFKENLRGRCSLDLLTASDDTLWSIGQHFGLYTPLIDWTRSPYVGLFFSLFGECKSGRRSLWALLESDVVEWGASEKSSQIRLLSPLTHDNARLVSQRGLFVYAPVGVSIEAVVQTAPDSDCVSMYKIEYPDDIRNDVLAALNNMNINHASLFPDLVGSALSANAQLEAAPHLQRGRTSGFLNDEF